MIAETVLEVPEMPVKRCLAMTGEVAVQTEVDVMEMPLAPAKRPLSDVMIVELAFGEERSLR